MAISKKDENRIKNLYGNEMLKLCLNHFYKLFKYEGYVPTLLEKLFSKNISLGDDIKEYDCEGSLKAYVYSFVDPKLIAEDVSADSLGKTPEELMAEKGYTLYPECLTEVDVQKFRHYYDRLGDGPTPEYKIGDKPQRFTGEELCTFNGERLSSCRIWFAVKNNVDNIKRAEKPKRDDEYGTSVISIQFTKGSNSTLSIKNRYNGTVKDPDRTLDNNLECIADGLTQAFEKTYGVKDNVVPTNSSSFLEKMGYILVDGVAYKYNYFINGIYYGPNNLIIKDGAIHELKAEEILIDYYIINPQEKTIRLFDKSIQDSFVDGFKNIKNIQKTKDGVITLTMDEGEDVFLVADKLGRLIHYKNKNLLECGDGFCQYGKYLKNIDLPNLRHAGDKCLLGARSLKELSMPKLESCGNGFCYDAESLEFINLQNVIKIGNDCFYNMKLLKWLSMPKLEICGSGFCHDAKLLETVDLSSLVKIGDDSLYFVRSLKELSMPKLELCGNGFCYDAWSLEIAELPNVIIVGDRCFENTLSLRSLELPMLEECGSDFCSDNKKLEVIDLPNLKRVGNSFFEEGCALSKLILPKLEECGSYFLTRSKIKNIDFPNLKKCGEGFCSQAKFLETLILPRLEECGDGFCYVAESLTEQYLPALRKKGAFFCGGILNNHIER